MTGEIFGIDPAAIYGFAATAFGIVVSKLGLDQKKEKKQAETKAEKSESVVKEIQEYSDFENPRTTLSEDAAAALKRSDGKFPAPAYKRDPGMAIVTGFTNSQISGKMPEEQAPVTKLRVGERCFYGLKITDPGEIMMAIYTDGKPAHNQKDEEYIIGLRNLANDPDIGSQLMTVSLLTKTMKGLGEHFVQFKIVGNDGRYDGVHFPSEIDHWDWVSEQYKVNLVQN